MSLSDAIAARVGRKYAAADSTAVDDDPDPQRATMLDCSRDALRAIDDGDEGGFLDAMLRLMDARSGEPVAPPAPAAAEHDPDLDDLE